VSSSTRGATRRPLASSRWAALRSASSTAPLSLAALACTSCLARWSACPTLVCAAQALSLCSGYCFLTSSASRLSCSSTGLYFAGISALCGTGRCLPASAFTSLGSSLVNTSQ